jgi:hypothetical protein
MASTIPFSISGMRRFLGIAAALFPFIRVNLRRSQYSSSRTIRQRWVENRKKGRSSLGDSSRALGSDTGIHFVSQK